VGIRCFCRGVSCGVAGSANRFVGGWGRSYVVGVGGVFGCTALVVGWVVEENE
jgi:hypothetical protein